MAKSIFEKIIQNNTFRFECEDDKVPFLNTKVSINDTFLCYISLRRYKSFLKDFSDLLIKYRD